MKSPLEEVREQNTFNERPSTSVPDVENPGQHGSHHKAEEQRDKP